METKVQDRSPKVINSSADNCFASSLLIGAMKLNNVIALAWPPVQLFSNRFALR